MIRLATIGTNFITDWLMEGILELDEIQLTAVYSRNLEKGKQFAAKYNVEKVYDNYEEMAKDPEIDAVYVASPTYMHYVHSITMINYGKHVLCEKPVCSNREELDILIKAAKEQGVVFMEAMKNVKENLKKLSQEADIWIRIPMVHHVNDTEEELNEMIEFISSLGDGVKKIQLLKYHSLGKMKYQWIGKECVEFEEPDELYREHILSKMRELPFYVEWN